MRRRALTGLAASALAIALAATLGGCTAPFFAPSRPSTTSAPTNEKVAADLAPFYHQVLQWSSCADGMQCAKASAPLDWAHPADGSIELALIRKPAQGERLGSLLVNPGGPGASGVDLIRDSLDYAVDKRLQGSYDIVGFDPRGVGASSAVKCYGPAKMDDFLYGITPGERGSDAWIAAAEKEATAFGQACKENTGALLGQVDTVSAAHDLDLMRAVLGNKRLNYLGYSYGTYLGAVYAGLYPKNVGRLVLDGALDPSATNFEVSEVQAQGFESALRAYLTDCLNGKNCPFRGSVDGAMAAIGRLLSDVAAHPIANGDGRMLGADTLVTAIIYPLYEKSAWPALSDLFRSVALNHSAAYAFQLADAYNDRTPDGTYKSNSTEAFLAINCLDYHYNDDPAVMRKQAAKLAKAAPVIGPYMAYGDIGCASWPYQSTVDRQPITAAGAAPILVVGTTNDPATPYRWAQSLAKQLQSGHLVTYKGEGHTAYNKSNACVNGTVDDYFVSGTVPKTDPHC